MKFNPLALLKNRSFFEIAVYGVLLALQKGAGLLLLPITTSFLTLAQYGLLETIMVLLVFCSLLDISSGALPRFYADAQNSDKKNALIASALQLSLVYGVLLALATCLLIAWLPVSIFASITPEILWRIGFIIFLMTTLQPLLVWLRIEQRAKAYFVVVVTQTLIQLSVALYGLYAGMGLIAILNASCISAATALLIALWISRKQWWQLADKQVIRETSRYQIYLIGASLSLFVMHGLDRLLLAGWLGPETMARYAIMIKVMEIAAVAFGVLETWWLPRRFTVLKQQQGESQVAQVHLYMLAALCSLLLTLLLITPHLLTHLFPVAYHQGLVWLPFMLLAAGTKLATAVMDIGCYLPKKPVWLTRINAISAVVALALYFLLIPRYGVWGLLIASNCVYFARLCAFTLLSQRIHPLPYQAGRVYLMLLPVLISLFVTHLFPNSILSMLLPIVSIGLIATVCFKTRPFETLPSETATSHTEGETDEISCRS